MHMGCELGEEEGEGWDCGIGELMEGAKILGMLEKVGLLVEGVVLALVVGVTKNVSKKFHLCNYFHFLLDCQSHGTELFLS